MARSEVGELVRMGHRDFQARHQDRNTRILRQVQQVETRVGEGIHGIAAFFRADFEVREARRRAA